MFLPNKKQLINLYIARKLSTRQIAAIYLCSKSTINSYLSRYDIPLRTRSEAKRLRPNPERYIISKKELGRLYAKKLLSGYQIAEFLKYKPTVVFNRLKKYDIQRRTLSEAVSLTSPTRALKIAQSNTLYPKKDFIGTKEEKAYLIGFRLGDLHVTRTRYGITIIVKCWSTKPEQITLIKSLFENYGHITLSYRMKQNKEDTGITCYLNGSFNFLLANTDSIPAWILRSKKSFLSFAAGYIDAEGNFRKDRNWGRFSLSSYQKNIIYNLYLGFNKYSIVCPHPYISVDAGYIDKRGVITRQDLWTIRVNKQLSISKMYSLISPYMKHAKRLRDVKIAYETALRIAS